VLLCSVMGYGSGQEEVRDVWLLPSTRQGWLRFRTRVLKGPWSLLPTPPHVVDLKPLKHTQIDWSGLLRYTQYYRISSPKLVSLLLLSHMVPYLSCQHTQQPISLP
jgi:hypothetical protein